MQRVFLIRHGEAPWNAAGRYLGQTDQGLNEKGKKEAEALARRFKDVPVDSIYCSDLKRTQLTAEAIAKLHQLEVKSFPELNEFDFGSWEGLTFEEIEQKFPGKVDRWRSDITTVRVPGGESAGVFLKRIRRALEKILTENPNGTVVVVTHGGPIKAFIFSFLGSPVVDFSRLRIESGSVTAVDFEENGKPLVWLLNDTSHL